MKKYFLFIALLSFQCSIAQLHFNGDMEQINIKTGRPVGWSYGFDKSQQSAYPVGLDSVIKQSGKYSLVMQKVGVEAAYGVIDYPIPANFEGYRITVRAYMKTENINGYAGIWLRLDGEAGTLALDNMEESGVKGTTEWKQYSINMNYQANVTAIHVGGLISGSGKAWFDHFEVLLDGKPIDQAKLLPIKPAQADTAFNNGSRISAIAVTPQQITNLTLTGQLWGFLKYHHPAIAKGAYNWDAELFRLLPSVIAAKNNSELSSALEKYIDLLPVPPPCAKCDVKIEGEVIPPDYGDLLSGKILSKSLTDKISYIKTNRNIGDSYYIGVEAVGNPKFKNENAYVSMTYPDMGYRLLTLYRYWAMINYYFPYKNITDTKWNQVLSDFIPDFIAAKDAKSYTLTTLRLIAKVQDTHANIWGGNKLLNEIKGKYAAPFQAKFVEGNLVITGKFVDSLVNSAKLSVGDIIFAINGKKVNDLVKEFLPLTPASNYEAQLRDLPREYLLRTNAPVISITVNSKGKVFDKEVRTINAGLSYKNLDYSYPTDHRLINKDIGYVYPGKYKNQNLNAIADEFKDTKGIVVDMRCYPSEFMPFTFGNYIKASLSPFVKFTKMNRSAPGSFSYSETISNGGNKQSAYNAGNGPSTYTGKVVVIVDATSQSQAEYTTMAFQSSPNVKVIGSTTAGADGNVSSIILPGGIVTMISGLGVFYPDGTPTQRVGVKIDVPIKPTIKGVLAGQDELLDKAIELLHKGW